MGQKITDVVRVIKLCLILTFFYSIKGQVFWPIG
jgi:hypothetical protein